MRESGADAMASGQLLTTHYYSAFLFGQSLLPAANAILLGYLLFRSQLVPRFLPILGFIGALLLVGSWALTLFNVIGQVSATAALMAIPIATWEFSLGLFLTFRGFNPAPIINP
ncbi:hypothetical protein D9M68_898190 [compost metagenome]